jgi:hypothetical protein
MVHRSSDAVLNRNPAVIPTHLKPDADAKAKDNVMALEGIT